MFSRKTSIFFLILVLICATSLCLFSQESMDIENAVIDLKDSLLINFFKSKKLAPVNSDFSKSRLLNEFEETISFQKWDNFIDKTVKLKGIDIRASHFYISGDSTRHSNSFQQPHYSTFGVSAQTYLLKKPVQIGGDLVLVNGKINPNLSTLSINFDSNQFLSTLKEKYAPNTAPGEFFNKKLNPLDLSVDESKIFEEEFLFTIFQQIVAHPSFRKFATEKLVLNDSLHNRVDSILFDHKKSIEEITVKEELNIQSNKYDEKFTEKSNLDSLNIEALLWEHLSLEYSIKVDLENTYSEINKIADEIDKINALYSRYDELWHSKTERNKEVTNSLRNKLHDYNTEIRKRSEKDKLKKHIGRQKGLGSIDKILLYTQDFDLGLFSINRSDHIANYLSLNGIRFSYDNNKYFGELAYGNQSLSTQFAPTFRTFFSNNYFGRNVFYGNAGAKSSDGAFETDFSFLRIAENNSSTDTLIILPKKNMVLGWSGQMYVAENISFRTKVAVSEFESVVPDTDEDSLNEDDVSLNVSAFYEGQKPSWLYLEAGYFYNGKDYLTLGNPFLLTNRQGLNVISRIKLLKNKLSLNGDFKFSKNIDTDIVNPFKDLQFLGEVNYRFGKSNSISFRLMPNVFIQDPNALGELTSNNNIYSLQANFQSRVKSSQLFSIINLTNLRTDVQLVDTIAIDERSYLYVQEIFMMPNGNSINLALMTGFENFSIESFSDFLFQLDGTVQLNNLTLNIGSQLIKQFNSNDWQVGIVNRLRFNVFDRGTLSFNSIYRRSIDRKFGNNTLQANLSVIYSLINSQKQKLN